MTQTRETPQTASAADTVELPWTQVQPEHFRMLRLAPLKTDRTTGPRPLRFIQFGHAERHDERRSLLRMNIQLPSQRVHTEQNILDIWVEHDTQLVHCEPKSGLQTEPCNRGIGRFLLAQGVDWVQKHWPHYRFEDSPFPAKSLSEDARQRRNSCLQEQGFELSHPVGNPQKTYLKGLPISELSNSWNSDKVQFVELLEAGEMLQQAEQNLLEIEVKLQLQDEAVAQYKREDISLRFTIACLVAFALFQAGLLIWIATRH